MLSNTLRVGKGFDIHRLEEGYPFYLGGVKIDFPKGCVANSDGDVLIHALIDSLLGATGKGDIGMHFPDTDTQYKGMSSKLLLEKTLDIIPSCSIINIDMTVFCEQPELSPYRSAIEGSIASILGIPVASVNLKNKTMEKIGDIGSSNAVAADVVILLSIKGD